MIRELAHRFSRGRVFKRRLPSAFGNVPMFVSPEAALGYWRKNLNKVDPYLLSMVKELVCPGMAVWDIGANVGLFSFAAAALGAHVVAVEADLWLADLLRRSASLNHLPVSILATAVSDAVGFAPFYISSEGRASNSLLGEGAAQIVTTTTLDAMLAQFHAPQLVKIDVEGMEYAVLRGASETLKHRPTILCEVTQNHELVAELLRGAEYTLYGARQSDRQPLRRASIETLAIPRPRHSL